MGFILGLSMAFNFILMFIVYVTYVSTKKIVKDIKIENAVDIDRSIMKNLEEKKKESLYKCNKDTISGYGDLCSKDEIAEEMADGVIRIRKKAKYNEYGEVINE